MTPPALLTAALDHSMGFPGRSDPHAFKDAVAIFKFVYPMLVVSAVFIWIASLSADQDITAP